MRKTGCRDVGGQQAADGPGALWRAGPPDSGRGEVQERGHSFTLDISFYRKAVMTGNVY